MNCAPAGQAAANCCAWAGTCAPVSIEAMIASATKEPVFRVMLNSSSGVKTMPDVGPRYRATYCRQMNLYLMTATTLSMTGAFGRQLNEDGTCGHTGVDRRDLRRRYSGSQHSGANQC